MEIAYDSSSLKEAGFKCTMLSEEDFEDLDDIGWLSSRFCCTGKGRSFIGNSSSTSRQGINSIWLFQIELAFRFSVIQRLNKNK